VDNGEGFDPLEFLEGMGHDDFWATPVAFMPQKGAAHSCAPPCIAETSQIVDAVSSMNTADFGDDDEKGLALGLSCFELWQREGSTPALADSLSRHLARLRSRGFQLPWTCPVCGFVCASWFGACEYCKSSNTAYSAAAAAVLAGERASPRELQDHDHVLLALARAEGADKIEACFLMCEAMARAPTDGVPLYRRAFKLWPALDSDLYPDGVPSALRAEADALLAVRRDAAEGHSKGSSSAVWGIFPPSWQMPLSATLASQALAEVECLRSRKRREPDFVVVYSYHQAEGTAPGSWWEQARRSASALRRVHEDHIEFDIHVVSNVDTKVCDEAGVFDEHVLTDLAVDAGLPGKGRVLCGTKIQAMLNRFEHGYKKVVYMDSDTHVLRAFLSPILAVLDFYDVTGVFEGYPSGMPQTGLDPALADPLNFEMSFELNTGVLGLRASALELCKAWLEEYRAHRNAYAAVSSADQPALMQVLKHRSERVFPLPPAFNFRSFSVFSQAGPPLPAVVHDHHSDSCTAHKEIVDTVCRHLRAGLPHTSA